jgi:DNA-binding LytR/AlgR family response regulator
MAINCIIIEDQPPAQRILQRYIADVGSLDLKATFSDAIQGLEFLKNNAVDLIFLDIHLPKISGLDFLKSLQNPPKIILTTAFSEFALDSYEYNVVDYLLKPFSFPRFLKAISKIETKKIGINPKTVVEEHLFIKSGATIFKVEYQDILYIKSDGDYTEVTTKEKIILSTHSLKYWIENLPDSSFYQVHKSYIINLKAIVKVSGNQIYTQKETLPIGRTFKDKFTQKLL